MVLYLAPDIFRLEIVNNLFSRLLAENDEKNGLPILITTPQKLTKLLDSNQVNVEIIEKIFIENVSSFKAEVCNNFRIIVVILFWALINIELLVKIGILRKKRICFFEIKLFVKN